MSCQSRVSSPTAGIWSGQKDGRITPPRDDQLNRLISTRTLKILLQPSPQTESMGTDDGVGGRVVVRSTPKDGDSDVLLAEVLVPPFKARRRDIEEEFG